MCTLGQKCTFALHSLKKPLLAGIECMEQGGHTPVRCRQPQLPKSTTHHALGVQPLLPMRCAGLAIYNSHILEFSFPLVLYKQLTSTESAALEDLQARVPLDPWE